MPDDLKANDSLKTIPDVPTLAKAFVDTKALVGVDKRPKWNDKWTDKERDEWHREAGWPESADKYEAYKDGLKDDDELHEHLKIVRETAHELRLDNARSKALQAKFAKNALEGRRLKEEADAKALSEAETALKKDWGDKWNENVEVANKAVATFGDPEFVEFLASSKLGNHPKMIRMMEKVGRLMMDDKALAAKSGFKVTDQESAKAEIEMLKNDKVFMDSYFAGNQVAMDRINRLRAIAYAEKK